MSNLYKHIDHNDELIIDSESGKVVGIVARNDGLLSNEQHFVFAETNLTGSAV